MEKKMRNVFIVLIVVIAASVALAGGSTVVFKYVDSSGALSFTDDENRVPEMYKAKAEKVTLGALEDYERFTAVSPAPEAEAAQAVTAPTVIVQTVAPATEQDCGTITVRSERRDVETNSGGSNTRFYIAEDDCGVLFDAPYYPELNALRR
jgi:hypothetical protein